MDIARVFKLFNLQLTSWLVVQIKLLHVKILHKLCENMQVLYILEYQNARYKRGNQNGGHFLFCVLPLRNLVCLCKELD